MVVVPSLPKTVSQLTLLHLIIYLKAFYIPILDCYHLMVFIALFTWIKLVKYIFRGIFIRFFILTFVKINIPRFSRLLDNKTFFIGRLISGKITFDALNV